MSTIQQFETGHDQDHDHGQPLSPSVQEKHLETISFGDAHEVGIELYRKAGEVDWTPQENRRM
jgi:hypothetical protein